MFEVILFSLFIGLFILFPGWFFTRKALEKSPVQIQIILSLSVGLAIFIYVSFLIRFVGLPFTALYAYAAILVIVALRHRLALRDIKKNTHLNFFTLVAILLLTATALALASGHLSSGYQVGELRLVSARDGFWRLSIIAELTHRFPPQIPGFPPILLKNYHFFYDLLIASASMVTHIGIIPLYTRYFTLLSAFFLVATVYALVREIVQSHWLALIGSLLTVLTGNLSYVLPLLSSRYQFFSRSNIFMADSPFDQSHNPFNLLAYALFLTAVLLVLMWERKRQRRIFFVLGIITGVLIGVKIYAGLLVTFGIGVIMAYELFVKKKFHWQILSPLLLTLPVVATMKGPGFSLLIFNPGWLLIKMIEDLDRLNLTDMALKEQYYRSTGNIFRLFQLKTEQLLLYLVGNLNIRLLALGYLVKKFRSPKLPPLTLLFMVSLTVAALGIPLFFSQSRAVYDSIQFTPYALLLLSIFAVSVLEKLFLWLKRRTSTLVAWLGVGILVLVAVPTNIDILVEKLKAGAYVVSSDEVSALQYIKRSSGASAIILTDLDSDKMTYMYVPAISERRTYLSGPPLVEQTGVNTLAREQAIRNFFEFRPTIDGIPGGLSQVDTQEKKEFLTANNIQYIFLSESGLSNRRLLNALKLPLVYENPTVVIYEHKAI